MPAPQNRMTDRPAPTTADGGFYAALKARHDDILAEYRRRTPRSAALFARASEAFPGGFTRDAIYRTPYTPFIVEALGTRLIDADGQRLTDFWFNATALPLGHAAPEVVAAATAQVARGSAYFGPTETELALADLLIGRLPCAERVRFTNSGSEAVMMAVRLARAATGRSLILKCEGSYHGSYDDVSWSIAPEAAVGSAPVADTAGLAGHAGRVGVVPFNDPETLERAFADRGGQIAALLIEPVANRMGLILPEPAFLTAARRLCDRHGAALIFDEVIAFRLGYRGAQGTLGVVPDLVTLGKVIAGGFPGGAVAGRADILDLSAPDRPDRVAHAGTYNGNPTTAAAGLATLTRLTPETFAAMNAMGATVRRRLSAATAGLPLTVTGAGSLFKLTAAAGPIRDYADAAVADKEWEALASLALLNRGFVLTTGLAGCVSAVTRKDEIDALVAAIAEVLTL
ncbi:aspartate aminotransferase family protein [Rhodobacteraceae bacterium CCMM004]|nr:aspartate aminotransferase family protein [Rhodobacteraceae bacterium CCMM004]